MYSRGSLKSSGTTVVIKSVRPLTVNSINVRDFIKKNYIDLCSRRGAPTLKTSHFFDNVKIWIFISDSTYSRSKSVDLNGLQRVLQKVIKNFENKFWIFFLLFSPNYAISSKIFNRHCIDIMLAQNILSERTQEGTVLNFYTFDTSLLPTRAGCDSFVIHNKNKRGVLNRVSPSYVTRHTSYIKMLKVAHITVWNLGQKRYHFSKQAKAGNGFNR